MPNEIRPKTQWSSFKNPLLISVASACMLVYLAKKMPGINFDASLLLPTVSCAAAFLSGWDRLQKTIDEKLSETQKDLNTLQDEVGRISTFVEVFTEHFKEGGLQHQVYKLEAQIAALRDRLDHRD